MAAATHRGLSTAWHEGMAYAAHPCPAVLALACRAYAFIAGVPGLGLEDQARMRYLAHACVARHLAAADPGK